MRNKFASVVINKPWLNSALSVIVSVTLGFLVWTFNPWFVEVTRQENREAMSILVGLTVLIITVIYHHLYRLALQTVFREQIEMNDAWLNDRLRLSLGLQHIGRDIEIIPLFAEILRGHLKEANATTELGTINTMNALADVHTQCESLLATLRNQEARASNVAEAQVERSAQNALALKGLYEYQLKRNQQISEDGARIHEVLLRVGGLRGLTQIIRGIAKTTNLLALNAAIEAARAGGAGRSFAVVADEVRKLSQQTEKATSDIDHFIEELECHITENLTAIVSNTPTDTDLQHVQTMADQLAEITRTFNEVSSYLFLVGTDSRRAMTNIYEDISVALGHLQFQDISRQQIEQISAALDAMNEHFTAAATIFSGANPSKEWPPFSDRIERLREGYVMHSQRATHSAAAGKSTAEAGPAIELF